MTANPELSSLLDNSKPLVEGVAEALKEGVIKQIISPGEKVTETALAKTLGVSRTPVREALRLLEAEGILFSIPGQGFAVVNYSFEEIINFYVVRETLEGLSARLAAENISAIDIMMFEHLVEEMEDESDKSEKSAVFMSSIDFHNAIAKATKNAVLISFLKSIYTSITIFRRASFNQPTRDRMSFEEHRAIARAICERNPELAELRAREHMQKALKNLTALWVDNHFISSPRGNSL